MDEKTQRSENSKMAYPRTGSGSTRSGTSSFGGVGLRFIGVERRLDEETRSTSASGDTSLLWFLEEEVAQMQLG
jgi:hypothetical protein